ncbi:MAG: helix-turn-helix domain-containing protein, partial [Planctomycetota bacterium]
MSRLPAAQRREQLLDHAADLFSRHGYARATTAELAKSAGITEPIIYRHFASKRDLFIALIERSADRTLAMWETHLAGATDPAERLRRLIGDNPMVADPTRDAYRVLLQATTEV